MFKRFLPRFLILITAVVLCLTVSALAADGESFDGYLVCLSDGGEIELLEAQEAQPVPYADGLYVVDSLGSVEALRRAGRVEYAIPNYTMQLLEAEIPNDILYRQQWTLSAIDYPELYASGLDGSGVTIAVIDSGVDFGTEDMSGIKVSPFSRNLLGDGSHADAYYRDQAGHGTFVASRIAPATNNGRGLAGIAPGAELMVLRCVSQENSARYPYDESYDSGSSSLANVISAIRYAADNGADVINLSLGTEIPEAGPVLQSAVTYAQSKGVIIVASVGNDGTGTLYFPAANTGVIGVGSVGMENGSFVHSDFSQVNSTVDVCAPGQDVLGVRISNGSGQPAGYGKGRGTSFATPVVSALVAVARQVQPALDAEGCLSLLASTAVDCGEAGRDTSFGYGVVNAAGLKDALLSRSYTIEYVLNDTSYEPAVLPADVPDSYTLGSSVTLPVPTRASYSFEGWYADAACTQGPLTSHPAGAVGPLRETRAASGVTYEVAPVTYYAKWANYGLTALETVSVRSIPAVSGENATLRATLPSGSVSSLSQLTAADIVIKPVSELAAVSQPVASEGGAVWTFTVTGGGNARTYTLHVRLSAYPLPAAANSQTERRGTALTPAMDGSPAVPFVSEMKNWFTGVDIFEIISCDGSGSAAINGSVFTYTPGDGDFAGRVVTVEVGGSNADFTVPVVVRAVIRVERQPSNSSVIWEAPGYDLYAGGHISGIRLILYDNAPSRIRCDDTGIPANYCIFTEPTGEDSMHLETTLTIDEAFAQTLLPGEHTLTIDFSGGNAVTVPFTVTDSAPLYSVEFRVDGGLYFARSSVRAGSALAALPPEPVTPGTVFDGWFTEDGEPVTAETTVTDDMVILAEKHTASEDGYVRALLEHNRTAPIRLFTENARITVPTGTLQTEAEAADLAKCFAGGNGDLVARMDLRSNTELVPVSVGENGVASFVYSGPGVYFAVTGSSEFDDIDTHWGRDSILFTASRSLFRGVSASSFAPDSSMTRAMLVTVLYRLSGSPAVESASPFMDVAEGQWYTPAVIWAYENGIVNGISVDLFAPGRTLTREQLVTMLYRYVGYRGLWYGDQGSIAGAPDAASVSRYARAAFSWAMKAGIIRGTDAGLLMPRNSATRAQVAAVMERVVQYILK